VDQARPDGRTVHLRDDRPGDLDGGYDADYPYLVLTDPPWGTKAGAVAANAFLAYARGTAARSLYLTRGYRDANGVGGTPVTAANGVRPTLGYRRGPSSHRARSRRR
jgi:hypothetical protein